MAKMQIILASHQASEVTVLGEKKIWDFDLFCPRSGPKREPNFKSAPKFGTFASFFNTLNFEPP